MERITKAISAGRCALAVSGTLLRDDKVVLALSDRADLQPMTLSGPPVPPVDDIQDTGLARALGQPHGVLVLVDPQPADLAGIEQIVQRVRQAPHKPVVVLVSRKLDFQIQARFMGLKTESIKERGLSFLTSLPMPPPLEEAPVPDLPKPTAAKAAVGVDAPGPLCVGRDEELAWLAEALAAGGPIVINGPSGIGKRTLTEHAIAAANLQRSDDLVLDRDTGFDALFGRLITLLEVAGQRRAHEAWSAHAAPPALIEALLEDLTHATDLQGHAVVIRHAERAWGPDGGFFRKSRLELLIEALCLASFPLRLVFLATSQPIFYREGRDANLKRLTLGGLKGRDYHTLFQAFHAPEFPRERFGSLSERLHGHPLAVRLTAVAMRHHPSLVDDDKAFQLKGLDDSQGLRKLIDKRLKPLADPTRRALAAAAHFRSPAPGRLLSELGITRKVRDALILDGLLAVVGGEGLPRRYYVPEPVVEALGHRETADFETMHRLSPLLLQAAEAEASPAQAFALRQESNRLLDQSRRERQTIDLGLPDADSVLDNVAGMLRTKKGPRPDIAATVLASVIKRDPSNADAWLLELERLRLIDAPAKERKTAVATALEQAPVPELFHEAVGFYRSRGQILDGIEALEQGVQALPDHSRLRCRLASLLYRQGRRPDAIKHLEAAMEADPMLPDAYGLLGTIRMEEGVLSIDRAEDLLREAVRLAPQDVVQTSRLIRLLLDIAQGVPERREAVQAEIQTLLEALWDAHKDNWEVHLLFAEALRAQGADPERAAWFLKEARKLAPRRASIEQRFRVEKARQDLATGRVDDAERALRDMARKDPSNAQVVQLLAEIHAARGHHIAAHAELSRALDRMSPHALERQRAEARLQELTQLLQAGVAPSPPIPEPGPEPEPVEDTIPDATASSSGNPQKDEIVDP